jgi:hypothetical protein
MSPLKGRSSILLRPKTNLQGGCELVNHEGELGVKYSQTSSSSMAEIVLVKISNSIMFCLLLREKISNPDA